MKLKVLYILLIAIAQQAFGDEHIRFSHITTRDGLLFNQVTGIAQDKSGFMWFSTNAGLARFDGYSFTTFQPNPFNKNSLSSKNTNNIYFDMRGNLWVMRTTAGIDRLNIETERFYRYFPEPKNVGSISGISIRRLFESKDSSLWVATENGLDLYNPAKDCFTNIFLNKDLKLPFNVDYISGLTEDETGNIWFNCSTSVICLNKKTHALNSLGQICKNNQLDKLGIATLTSDRNQFIWFCTRNNGLYQYNTRTGKISAFLSNVSDLKSMYYDKAGHLYVYADAPKHSVYVFENVKNGITTVKDYKIPGEVNSSFNPRFAVDQSGHIWLATHGGLFLLDKQTGITKIESNRFIPNTIADNYIDCIFIDPSDNLWIGPLRKGINRADLKQKEFKWLVQDESKPKNTLPESSITSICEDHKHQLWIGCFSSNISCYNPLTETFKNYSIKQSSNMDKAALAVSSLYEDHQGYIWIGYYGRMLDRLDPKNGNIEHMADIETENSPKRFRGAAVRKIVPAPNGNIWLAAFNGLIEYNFQTKTFTNHSELYDKDFRTLNSFFRSVVFDRNQNIWICSQNGGLIYYNISQRKFTHYRHEPSNNHSISSNAVYTIYQQDDSIYWVGTSLGLNQFNRLTGIFSMAKSNQELTSYGIFSILPDTMNHFWISSDKGLIRYNYKLGQTRFYNEYDGVPNAEFNTTAYCQTSSRKICIGSSSGMIIFEPAKIIDNTQKVKPKITRLLLFNKALHPGDTINNHIILRKQIWNTSEIELNHNENDFTLEFSAMHYAAPEKNEYFYTLEGFNEGWVAVSAQHRWATFTGLQPGSYTFKLKATNNDGVLCEPQDQVTLRIVIRPPFWATWWFKLLIFVIVGSSLFLYVRYRINSLRKQKQILENKVQERTRDLETTNTLLEERQEEISIQKEEILSQYENLEQTNILLTEHQEKIIEQNKELDQHRNQLEKLVAKRTVELEKALAKAEESDKLKSSFLANMSHEIRTPMNAIIGFSSLLKDINLPDEERNEFINIITNNGNSLLVLINEILDLSSIQAQQFSLKPSDLPLKKILTECYEIFKVEANAKNLELQLEFRDLPDNFSLYTDQVRFKQVLNNLLTNAIKFTNSGRVEFGIWEITNKIIFYVKDSGIGIPKSAGSLIFERFLKLENNSNQLFRGAGLGLTICKNITTLWDGDIWYESEDGVGSTFYFSHPSGIDETNPIYKRNTQKSKQIDFSERLIVVAEDEFFNYKLLETFLTKTKAKILWAHNGLEALEFVQNNKVDLVLMDIKMPIMNGIEASIRIKEIQPDLPIIAQTAFAFKNEIEDMMKAGINDYLTKPISQVDLYEKMKRFLKGY